MNNQQLAKSWEEWIEKNRKLSDPQSIIPIEAHRKYVMNRLWTAYMAGADAAEKIIECDKPEAEQ